MTSTSMEKSVQLELEPLEMPNYSLSEVAFYLQIPHSTLQSWVKGRAYLSQTGRKKSIPIIETPIAGSTELSHINLVEAYVLDAIRRGYRISLQKVRSALGYVARHLPVRHPLAMKMFQTDGLELFIDHAGNLINVSMKGKIGQLGLRKVLEPYLERIEYDEHGLPMKLYPFTRSGKAPEEPKSLVIRPLISSGRPVLAGTRIAVEILVERFTAGDSIDELADDYGLKRGQIEEAIRCWSVYQSRAA
jgi:uncharacterized protein (DUF433 family)